MIFCERCFNDRELRNIISSNSKERIGVCPVCGEENVHLYDSDKDNYLTSCFEDLLSKLMPKGSLDDNYPVSEVRSIADQIHHHWSVFSTISAEKQVEILKSLCGDSYEYYESLFEEPVGVRSIYDESFIKEHSLLRNNSWDDFKREIKTVNRYHSKMLNFALLERFCSFIRKEYKAGDVFYRGRISDCKGFPPEEMSAPPAGMSSEGRANAKGITCLYLANDVDTVLHEVRAGLYDYVTVGKFVLKKDITVVNLKGICDISPFLSDMDFLDYAINKDYLVRLDEDMSKSLRRNDSTLDYVPTQYVTDFIKSIEHDNMNEYSGIEYKSTTNPSGYNLAIFLPDLFQCVSAEVIEIEGLKYDFGARS